MKKCVNSLSIVYGVLVFFSYCLLEDEEEHNIDAPLFAYCYRFSITGPGLISNLLSHRELIDQIQCRKMHLNGGCRGFHTLKMQFK